MKHEETRNVNQETRTCQKSGPSFSGDSDFVGKSADHLHLHLHLHLHGFIMVGRYFRRFAFSLKGRGT